MKKTLILFTFISLSFTVFGQWVNGTDKVTTTDRVGIGTTSTSNAITTITTSESTNILRLVNDGSGNESSIRLRSKNTSGSFLHADMAVYSTGSNTGYLGFKVPHNNTVNSGYDFIINHLGQMGLGTTSPSATFDAIKDQNNESIIRIVNSTAGTSASAGFKVNSQGNNVRLISFADAHSTNANENWLVSQAGGSSLVFGTQDLERMRINAHGNVGIGTNSPTGDGLTVVGGDSGQDFLTLERPNIGKFRFNSGGYSTRMTIGSNNVDRFTLGWDNSEAGFAISNDIEFSTHEHAFFIKNTGNVGIGTTDPDAKLTVKGNIKSKEIKVEVNAGEGPDYVFEEDYNLRSLEETEEYIKANKHLPEVPSAKVMESEGLNLKEMNLMLLQKIEELTLHQIEQNKSLKSAFEKIESLENEIEQLKEN